VALTSLPHDSDDLLDRWWIGGIAHALVGRDAPLMQEANPDSSGSYPDLVSRQLLPVLPITAARVQVSAPERGRLVRRARLLAWLGLGWHIVEAAVAIIAGVIASSVALVGFGADSLIEAAAGIVVIWLMTDARSASASAERRAQQLIAASFAVLTVYISVEAIRDLAAGHHPQPSWVGIGLSVVTLATMPPLARAKRRVGEQLGSSATASESRQTMLCAYLSAALLVGLVANAALGWWWADPTVALAIAAVAAGEARNAWRGDSCSCCG
jgi:divalent metal cation (Fe/Co/Zn/Cd) transporter